MMRNQTPEPVEEFENTSTPPDHVGVLFASVLLMLIGWGGLYLLITTALPRIGGELWAFFLLLQLAITGTTIPIVRFLNVQLTPPTMNLPSSGVIVRQSVWLGLFGVIIVWLRIPRALTVAGALFIALVFIIIEAFLRTREIASENY